MRKKLNAAIVILVARKKILYRTLDLFYINWNNFYKYPVHIHTFGRIFNDKEILQLQKKYTNIFFHSIKTKIPTNLEFKDLFFYRFYNNFAFKSFNPLRLNYLHMCNFTSNISSFGKTGCINKELEKYDYLMRIDDDSWLKNKINKDLFIALEKHPMASGRLTITKNSKIHLTRERLFFFIKNYVNKHKIKVKNNQLKKILNQKDEKKLSNLQFSLGNFDLYNMSEFKSKRFKKFINAVNKSGGIYKYRWADYDLLNLYLYMFYKKPLHDFKFSEKLYSDKYPGSKKIFGSSNLTIIQNNFFKIIVFFIIKNIIKIQLYCKNVLK